MNKQNLKAIPFIGSNPIVMVSCGKENTDIITIAWAGVVNSIPPKVAISIRPERFSHSLIKKENEFVINIVTKELLEVCDGCGICSGKNTDKFKKFNLKKINGYLKTPAIKESPINIECKLTNIIELGSHTMFIADIINIMADENIIVNEKIDLSKIHLISYANGEYHSFGENLAGYGFSIKK